MLLLILSYLGGALTILSPCILPVLPFVFARADRPFIKSGLPMLAGMALTFAAVATLAAVGGGWAVAANQYGRFIALALLAVFGLTLVFPAIAERLTRPLVNWGAKLSSSADKQDSGVAASALLGMATGLLWAPCAGPILGLVLTGAALQGANAMTSLLLLAYALGAATSLALALLVGGRVFTAMKRSLGAGERIRQGLGIAVLVAVAAIGMGLDTGLLTRLSLASTAQLEEKLLNRLRPAPAKPVAQEGASLPVEGDMPALTGAVEWLNSPPLTKEELRGKVVLVDFWTYSCINCLRTLPYVRAWAEKYKDQGLVVIGVHAPEFAFEKDIGNVQREAANLGITYPVAIDNNYAIWRAFDNSYWPAHYFVDAQGRIRHHHFGEGEYEESERVIQQLLAEAGRTSIAGGFVDNTATGAEAAPDMANIRSPETYIGYERTENFASQESMAPEVIRFYSAPTSLNLNQWALDGKWKVETQRAVLIDDPGKIVYRFHARDLHLVLGPAEDGQAVKFRIRIDGQAPGDDHGADVNAEGEGAITTQRLYQLVRQKGDVQEHTFEIEFLDAGAQAFAFTFG